MRWFVAPLAPCCQVLLSTERFDPVACVGAPIWRHEWRNFLPNMKQPENEPWLCNGIYSLKGVPYFLIFLWYLIVDRVNHNCGSWHTDIQWTMNHNQYWTMEFILICNFPWWGLPCFHGLYKPRTVAELTLLATCFFLGLGKPTAYEQALFGSGRAAGGGRFSVYPNRHADQLPDQR